MNRFHTHLTCSYGTIHILIDVVAELIVFQFICFNLPILLFCMPHVTLSYFIFCVEQFITFTFDKEMNLDSRAAFFIHISSKTLEFCCNTINTGIKFTVMTVILYFRKFLVKFFRQIIWKTKVFSEPYADYEKIISK